MGTWFSIFNFWGCAKARGLVCLVFVARKENGGQGIEDREVYASDKVKDVFRLGEPPMSQTMLRVSKGGSPWKGQVGWDGVAYLS